MTQSLLLTDWPAIAAAGPEHTGGKAGNLARLARYGFPVPAGMCLPAEVHDLWLAGSGLRNEALHLCAAGDAASAAQWQALQQRLEAAPLSLALSEALSEAWRSAVHGAAPWAAGSALALRSSSPQEDSAQASFAGIHRSLLNVAGTDLQGGPDDEALWRAVVAVWCSLWTPAAAAYRGRMGLAHEEARMAVLIMPLVAAQASGIGFTHDPSTGRSDRLLIHANWGLGESLVGGQARGDEIVLASTPLDHRIEWLSQRIGEKQQQTSVRADGGTHLNMPDDKQRATAVLSKEQAIRLGSLLQQAALALDWERPAFDCEWAWDGSAFWLLQARPITAMARHTYAGLRDQPEILSRGNTREISPFPLQPIDWSGTQGIAFPMTEITPRTGGFPVPPALPRLAIRQGYLYLNMSLMQWESWAAFGMSPQDFNGLLGGHHGEIRTPAPTWRLHWQRATCFARILVRGSGLRRLGRRQAEEALQRSRDMTREAAPDDDAAMARLWHERIAWFYAKRGLLFMQGSGGGSLWMLVRLIERWLPGQGHSLASAMLAAGVPSVTAQQSLDLVAVARVARDDALARNWLEGLDRQAADGAGAEAAFRDADWRALPADNPFRLAFASFLERYGHRATYETYIRHPRWREAPGYLLQQLAGLMTVDLEKLRDTGPARAAMAQVRRALPWWQGARLSALATMARIELNDRELARSALMSAIEPTRKMLLTQGQRWVKRGWLDQAEDSFFLCYPEMLAVMEEQRDGSGLRELVADRRREMDRQSLLKNVPDVILEGSENSLAVTPNEETAAPAGHDAAVLHGVCVGRGQVTATACTMHSPVESARLQKGDILVVPSTDPSWTPLFLKAGGLVMETGGFLSHGAIVAREFGIPAVVNVPGIMRHVRDGQRLHVDAAQATVTLLDAVAGEARAA